MIFNDVLKLLDAFFGGRTENIVANVETRGSESISYVDICSLYPYICKAGKFSIGHPQIYVGDECKRLTGVCFNLENVEGSVKCTVLPPKHLFLPMLPVKIHNKLMFPLCRFRSDNLSVDKCVHKNDREKELTCIWVSDELKTAANCFSRMLSQRELINYIK